MAEDYGVTEETLSADDLIGGSHGTIEKAITLAEAAGDLDRGQVLGRVTASGEYAAYDAAAEDGTETPRAILARDTDASAAAAATVAYVHGEFNEAALTGNGADDAAKQVTREELQAFGIIIKVAL